MTRPLDCSEPADAAAIALSVDRRQATPLGVQLVRQLREMILSGRMAAGSRLPSSRALAVDLGVSRATVVDAFDQLVSEGYLEGRHGAGMFVPSGIPGHAMAVGSRGVPDRQAARSSVQARPEPQRPFQVGAWDASLLPLANWTRRFARVWRVPSVELTGSQHPFGLRDLRLAIARHLEAWRAISVGAERIVVTSGTVDATELVVGAALPDGGAALVEDPGYPSLRHALQRQGVTIVPVPVDADGFDVAQLGSTAGARLAIVTPSRQFPLGATLPLARRLALLEWARRSDGFVVEDDFDSEYRYAGTPLPALTSLDRDGRTIYVGSFSKTLLPALRLGFVVLPERLVPAAERHLRRRGQTASLMMQPVLADFMASGDFATHIRRTRRIYARRLDALMAAGVELEGLLVLRPATSGMHLVADIGDALADRLDDRSVAAIARAAGVVVSPLADHFAGPPTRNSVLLGFAGFGEARIRTAIRTLARALRRAG
jgi:GntR family transcriptional regulator/MocR family aminotransferase